MPTTPNRGYPYQTDADPPDGPNLGEDGFLAVDADMVTQIARIAALEARVHMTRIAESILVGTAASVTFSSIPATYRSLQLHIVARSDTVATFTTNNLRFNGDTANNYDSQSVGANVATVAGAESIANVAILLGEVSAASAAAGAAASYVINIPFYGGTTFWKNVISNHVLTVGAGVTTAIHSKQFTGRWRNTAAINSINVFPGAGNYIAGSSFVLYGLP